MEYLFIKQQFVSSDQPVITAEDRSFRFGDGIFETLLVQNGRMFDYPNHHKRLSAGLEYFGIKLDISELEQHCHQLIEKNKLKTGYVRIVVSRGENGPGAIGYLAKNSESYYLIQTVKTDFPAFKTISLCESSHRAYHHLPCKINSAMHYAMAMKEAAEKECDNALIISHDGYICETASGNIFWVRNKVLYTPELSLPFVPGTIRNTVLELWDGEKEEGHYIMDDLLAADEVFMTNIGHLVASVTALKPFGKTWAMGELTKEIRSMVENAIREETL